jgi:hypothetical protein
VLRGIGKFEKAIKRGARQRVEHITFAGPIDHVVKKGAELGSRKLHAGIGYDLD